MTPVCRLTRGIGGMGVILSLALFGGTAHAAEKGEGQEFDVAAMPSELAKEADAVVRLDTVAFVLESPKKATERGRRAVTILNQKGREFSKLVLFYDRFRQIKSLRGWIYDAQGRRIRDLKDSDVKDYSAITGYSLYEDYRVRVAELYHDSYPYTVAFDFEVIRNGLIDWPTWYPQERESPVERTSLEIDAPADMPVRYRPRGVSREPQVQRTGRRKVLRWEETALPKYEPEPEGPAWSEQAPSLLTAPTAFEIGGYDGDMSSWTSFGSWYHRLAAGRSTLPAPALAQVQRLCETAITPHEKVRRLYERLQATTRYVSVQLGIGGWQPFDAAYVHERGYGDCKALTNYMLAMLQAAGVPAYPALIRHGADEPDVMADFPSSQFNHVILFVPLGADTLWLECTSQTVPFGHLGDGSEDRNVLVVTPEGGKLLRTPRSRSTDNQQICRAAVTLNETGDGRAEVSTLYTGDRQDRVRRALAQSTPRDREGWLREEIDVPSFRLTRADFSDVEGRRSEIVLSYMLELPSFASRSGARLFLRPNLREHRMPVPPEVKTRTQPVDMGYAFLDVDTTSYRLPTDFTVEAAPPAVALETPFGSYHASTAVRDGVLDHVRRLEIVVHRLPASEYDQYRAFVADVVKADRKRIVLVRKN